MFAFDCFETLSLKYLIWLVLIYYRALDHYSQPRLFCFKTSFWSLFVCYTQSMNDTIFDKIVRGEMNSYKIWEDAGFIAFLTPFPNTPGLTIVIPKHNPGNNIFDVSDDLYVGLMMSTKKVAKILEKALDVKRVALVFEGTGVAYVHAKLYPLYGELAGQTDVWSDHTEFVEEYRGYFTTIEGPEMDESRLRKIQEQIKSVQ